jgi:hypothetical protein
MSAPPPRRRDGLPDVDALRDRADTEQAKLSELIAITSAESTVMDAQAECLADSQEAARQRISAAEARVSRAREDGDTVGIAAAQAQYEAACSAAKEAQAAGIHETLAILHQRKENFGAVQYQIGRTWDAAASLTRAVSWPDPPDPPDPPERP